jgi:hypothetical protein
MRRALFSVDKREVDETLRHLMAVNATFGVIHRPTRQFVPILKQNESFHKRGLRLYIEPTGKTASVHMQKTADIPDKIRWIDELYFTSSDNATPTSVKAYITHRYPVFWAS